MTAREYAVTVSPIRTLFGDERWDWFVRVCPPKDECIIRFDSGPDGRARARTCEAAWRAARAWIDRDRANRAEQADRAARTRTERYTT